METVEANNLFLHLVFIEFWYENILSAFANKCRMDTIPFITLEMSLNIGRFESPDKIDLILLFSKLASKSLSVK